MSETGRRFFNNALRCVALRCVALRCVALRCVALRCVAESFCLQIKSSKKRNILGKDAGKARNFKTAHALVMLSFSETSLRFFATLRMTVSFPRHIGEAWKLHRFLASLSQGSWREATEGFGMRFISIFLLYLR